MEIILALMITLAIEVNIFIFLDRKNIFLWLAATVMNIVLNVGMNVLLYYMPTEFWYWFTLWVYEILTFIIEGLIIFAIFKYKLVKCLLVSLIANASSFIVGYVINLFNPNELAQIIMLVAFGVIYNIGLGFVTYRYSKSRFLD